MYCYVYDKIVSSGRYKNLINAIENRLTDLGIQGEIERVTPIRHIKQCIEMLATRKCKTLVLVGDDSTISRAMETVAGKDCVIGYIPLRHGRLQSIFGLPIGLRACEVLSRRNTKKFDLGQVNGDYFLTTAEIIPQKEKTSFWKGDKVKERKVRINLDCKYDIHGTIQGLRIANLDPENPMIIGASSGDMTMITVPANANRSDSKKIFSGNWLNAETRTVLHATRLSIFGDSSVKITLDGVNSKKLPVNVSVSDKKIEFIVGSRRAID